MHAHRLHTTYIVKIRLEHVRYRTHLTDVPKMCVNPLNCSGLYDDKIFNRFVCRLLVCAVPVYLCDRVYQAVTQLLNSC